MPKKRLREILKNYSGDIILITNTNRKIVWINDWFTHLTGYSFEEVKGKNPGSFLQGEETNQDTVKKMRAALDAQENFNVNIVNYSKKREKYWLNISCSPVYDDNGDLEFFFAVQRDITSSYEKNQQKLNRLIEEQERLSEEKSKLIEFVYMLIHDLKAPLDNIERLATLGEIEDNEIKGMLADEISRLRTLINKVLPNNKKDLREVNLDVTEFNLYNIINQLIKNNKSSIEVSDLATSIACKKEITLKTDSIFLTQVLENLLVNAIKYSIKKTTIKFEITEENQNVSIIISNETDTLEDWKIKKLFTPFQNFDANFSKKSTGIGSYIVKRYVGLLGGDIKVTKKEKRVYFTITIPKEL